jgi:hypothetical protein
MPWSRSAACTPPPELRLRSLTHLQRIDANRFSEVLKWHSAEVTDLEIEPL